MQHQAVIFDLDGTLLDTLTDLADAMNEVLAGCGLPPQPEDSYRFHVGLGLLKLAEQASPPGTDPERFPAMAAKMRECYARNWANKTRPYPGIPELLADLRARGVKLAVLSNKPDAFTQEMVKHYFPAGTFDAVQGALDTMPIKPDPAGAFAMAEAVGVPPGACLYVGDTNTDMRTGLAAGMFTIGVSWGFRPVAELTGAGAQAVIDRPDQLPQYL